VVRRVADLVEDIRRRAGFRPEPPVAGDLPREVVMAVPDVRRASGARVEIVLALEIPRMSAEDPLQ
jgi:hypothetical protein